MNLAINTLKSRIDRHHAASKAQTPEEAQAAIDAELAQCRVFVKTLSQLRSSSTPTAKTFFQHSTSQSHHLPECPVKTHDLDLAGEFHDGLDDVADGEAGVHHIVKALGESWAKHHKTDVSGNHGESSTGFDVSQISQMVGLTEGLWKKLKRRDKHEADKKHVWEEDHEQDVEKAGGHWQDKHEKDVEMGRDMSSPAELTATKYGRQQLERYITWCNEGGEIPV